MYSSGVQVYSLTVLEESLARQYTSLGYCAIIKCTGEECKVFTCIPERCTVFRCICEYCIVLRCKGDQCTVFGCIHQQCTGVNENGLQYLGEQVTVYTAQFTCYTAQ